MIDGDRRDEYASVWDIVTGKERAAIKEQEKEAYPGAFRPGGDTCATLYSVQGTIKLWDLTTGKVRAAIKGNVGPTTTVAISHNGKLLASCGLDGAVSLWELPTRLE
jgi:WD40 repeat protein